MKELEVVRAYLADNEIEHEETSREGVEGASFSLSLPGEKKLQVPVRLDVGPHALGQLQPARRQRGGFSG